MMVPYQKYTKVLYTAGPYSANTKERIEHNVQVAHDVAEELWQMGFAVICPQKNSAFMKGEWEDFMSGDIEIIMRCDGVVMLPGWEDSRGATLEYNEAIDNSISVYFWPESKNELYAFASPQ